MYDQEQVMTAMWSEPGGKTKHTTEEVFKTIKKYIRDPEWSSYDYDVAVGTDSQMIGHSFQFISVISVHRIGKGGIYFFTKEFVPRAKFPVGVQKMRMFDEVTRSCMVGLAMKENVSVSPQIHIDASPACKEKEFTAKFSDQLKGYVQGMGFVCMLKPASYSAHAIADRHSKIKRKKNRHKKNSHKKKTN